MIGQPRRAQGHIVLERAVERGELDAGTDMELALDLLAAPIYWRLTVRDARTEPGYLDKLAATLCRALGEQAPAS
jgi:hypothetical protein